MDNFTINNYKDIVEIQPTILDEIYTITVEFVDGQVLSIGYANSNKWLKEYKFLMREWRK